MCLVLTKCSLLTKVVCNFTSTACGHMAMSLLIGADNDKVEEVKSKPAKAGAKPTKKPVLPDSVKAIAKASPSRNHCEVMHIWC